MPGTRLQPWSLIPKNRLTNGETITGPRVRDTPGPAPAKNTHWALIRTQVDAVPSGFTLDTPVDCFTSGISQYTGSALFLGGTDNETATFPAGTALPFKSGEILVLQLHGINATTSDASGDRPQPAATPPNTPRARPVRPMTRSELLAAWRTPRNTYGTVISSPDSSGIELPPRERQKLLDCADKVMSQRHRDLIHDYFLQMASQ